MFSTLFENLDKQRTTLRLPNTRPDTFINPTLMKTSIHASPANYIRNTLRIHKICKRSTLHQTRYRYMFSIESLLVVAYGNHTHSHCQNKQRVGHNLWVLNKQLWKHRLQQKNGVVYKTMTIHCIVTSGWFVRGVHLRLPDELIFEVIHILR